MLQRRWNAPWIGFGLFVLLLLALLAPGFSQMQSIFSTEGFDPHGHCYLWKPGLVRLFVISDTLIGTSYVAISLVIGYGLYRLGKDIPFPYIFVAFAAFIISCGITHFMDVWTLWTPTYWLSGYLKFATALISAATALMLPPLIPKIRWVIRDARMSQARKQQLIRTNAELVAEIEERQKVLSALRESEERLRQVIASAPVILWDIAPDGTIDLAEGKGLGRTGFTTSELVGRTIHELQPNLPDVNQQFNVAVSGQEATHLLETENFAFETRFSPLKDKYDKVISVIAVSTDITERRLAEIELRRTITRERELNDLKTHFITTMSHEFRTPLSIIATSTELLKRYSDRMTDERKREGLEKIETEIRNINALLEQVLTFEQIDTDQALLERQPTDLADLCRNAIQDVASRGTVMIRFEHDGDCPPVMVDAIMISRAVSNLLTNAAKYSPADGEVVVRLQCGSQHATITVSDSGIGIPENDLPFIFDRFFRGHNVGNLPGTGLGLAIVKQVVELHDGTIDVESKPGRGTIFTVRLQI